MRWSSGPASPPYPMQTRVKWTVEDYHRMIEAGLLRDRNVELLQGEIHHMPPEGPPHTFYGGSLADRFRNQLGNRALVREARPITLADSEPEPDLAIVKGTWDDYHYRHPSVDEVLLAIEVSESSLAKDLNEKRITYATSGIPDYWVLDLKQPQLIVFGDLQDGDYQSATYLQQGSISPLAFADIRFSVRDLLA